MASTVFSNSDALQPKNPQLEPLELNPSTGEPFLRVEGFDDIIITPLRWEDAPTFIPYMNDPAVYSWVSGPPVPYLTSDAEQWCNRMIPPQKATLFELEKARDQPALITLNACPVNSIRKVNDDGTDLFIGSVDIHRVSLGELVLGESGEYVVDMSRKEENQKRNEEREVGDPDIVWEIGDYLAPSYHGRGIMTSCVKTILTKWAVPRMNTRIVRVSVFSGNIGSQKVFLKNGFKHIATLRDHVVVRGRQEPWRC
ncbi:acyl-CoA N-acyltransferase [Coprinellus micaceus]|uniref:Acyl-CoA N-acyltransferase n=1 Tax=Coprinellus micaceus TaxID=71717 RepID=A0A4Y7SEX9_COPMI|nr:acyl-CoA N-acyltransferase [Coprinellus micaceus]